MRSKKDSFHSEEVLDIFRVLELETPQKREHFARLSEFSNGDKNESHHNSFLSTRNNTLDEEPVGDA